MKRGIPRITQIFAIVCLFMVHFGYSRGWRKYAGLRSTLNRKEREIRSQKEEFLEASDHSKYTEGYFTSNVDHFDFHNNATFQIRFLYNDELWNSSNADPIFFYCGNEGDIEEFWNNSGFLNKALRVEYNALVVFVEHRYFGKSLLFGNKSFDFPNTQYLTVSQAMADYNAFLSTIKRDKGPKMDFFCLECK